MTATLECGHLPTADTSSIGTGYAILTAARTFQGRALPVGAKVCYACSDAIQREDMTAVDRFDAYVSSDGSKVTTWSGGQLGRVTSRTTSGRRYTPTGGEYRTEYVDVRADDGSHWRGQGPGSGMYVRLRRSKTNA